MTKILIRAADTRLEIELLDTPTARAILAALPFESTSRTWGNEIYFTTPVSASLEADARDVIEPGEIAFWVEGRCIAIGFGPTPISRADEIRLAAPTNIRGKALNDVARMAEVADGQQIRVQRME